MNAEEVCGCAFGNLAAFIEQDHLIVAGLLRFIKMPDVVKPGCDLHACQRGALLTAVLSERQARRFAVRWQWRGANHEIGSREALVALPVTKLVVHDVNARTAFPHIIGAQQLIRLVPHSFRLEGKRAMRPFRIAGETLPVALECKRNSFYDADSGEQTPSAE